MNAKWKALIVAACALSVIALGVGAAGGKERTHTAILEKVLGVSAICNDGSYSTSKRKRGTCSGHGGIKEWIIKK